MARKKSAEFVIESLELKKARPVYLKQDGTPYKRAPKDKARALIGIEYAGGKIENTGKKANARNLSGVKKSLENAVKVAEKRETVKYKEAFKSLNLKKPELVPLSAKTLKPYKRTPPKGAEIVYGVSDPKKKEIRPLQVKAVQKYNPNRYKELKKSFDESKQDFFVVYQDKRGVLRGAKRGAKLRGFTVGKNGQIGKQFTFGYSPLDKFDMVKNRAMTLIPVVKKKKFNLTIDRKHGTLNDALSGVLFQLPKRLPDKKQVQITLQGNFTYGGERVQFVAGASGKNNLELRQGIRRGILNGLASVGYKFSSNKILLKLLGTSPYAQGSFRANTFRMTPETQARLGVQRDGQRIGRQQLLDVESDINLNGEIHYS